MTYPLPPIEILDSGATRRCVALLGDSIFDNASYVPGQPAVIQQLQASLPEPWQGLLLAVDGAVTRDVQVQLQHLPEEVSHVVISSGGNDALQCLYLLGDRVNTIGEALTQLQRHIRQPFRRTYRDMLLQAKYTGRPVTVCTIYNKIPDLGLAEQAALALFNEIILEEAASLHIPVLDLRVICDEADDYSDVSTIEPSARGGQKIVDAIVTSLFNEPDHHQHSFA
ncbi:SGNH/GDSL hydrolase family protein [Chitinilyticum aquatile]|uniref:SGNH/GDSL hydrolase family protein n=1 Tax=Chitinilyticum aquatile TaxID=362520 RepID=UPI001B7FD51C|nr:SGNH/GDSL hydrolase family protein [Chitinilyticum aquatile]